jgi:OmpA-OmpF porin, OOP family
MYKRYGFTSVALLSLAFAGGAHAETTPGFYVGGAVGEISVEVDEVDFDESDTGFKVFGGYAINPYFAVELAYFDGGTAEETFRAGPFSASIGVDISGLVASAVGRVPLGDSFALFGKLGFASYEGDVKLRVNGQVEAVESGSDEDIAYGVGAELSFGAFALRAEYEVIDASDGEINMLWLGGQYRF